MLFGLLKRRIFVSRGQGSDERKRTYKERVFELLAFRRFREVEEGEDRTLD